MSEAWVKNFLVCLGVIFVAAFTATVVTTISAGNEIVYGISTKVSTAPAKASEHNILSLSNLDDVTGVNLYKVLINSKYVVLDYNIKDKRNNSVELEYLLNNPTKRFKTKVTGDSMVGYSIVASEVVN